MHNDEYICRICGFIYEDVIWEEGKYPSHNICDCCGVEFGYEDCSLHSIRKYRNNWLSTCKGISETIIDQLNNIPEQYK